MITNKQLQEQEQKQRPIIDKVLKELQESNMIVINTEDALEDMKSTMLGLSKDIACHDCSEPFCCRLKKHIEISTTEWERVKLLVEPKHKERAKIETKRFKDTGVFNCPFNDPVTGKCDIYADRFAICAQHGVLNKKEHCDSRTEHGLQIVNPMVIFTCIEKQNTLKYMLYAAEGKPINLIDCFKE